MLESVRSNGLQKQRTSNADLYGKWGKVSGDESLITDCLAKVTCRRVYYLPVSVLGSLRVRLSPLKANSQPRRPIGAQVIRCLQQVLSVAEGDFVRFHLKSVQRMLRSRTCRFGCSV
jgi:hypothetical protein